MAFTDSFTGTENQNLEDRSGWTNVDAPTGGARINASNALKNNSTQSVSSYKCTDQGSADHYTQAKFLAATTGCFGVAVRLTNGNNFIAGRYESGAWQVFKRNAGTFTTLGSNSTTLTSGDVGYLEASGNSITFKVNGTTRVGPVTDSFNNTETGQGLIPRGSTNTSWIDDFEAGALGGGPTTYTHTASLNAAIRAAQSATASLSAAIQQPNTATASLSAAIRQAFDSTASIDAAILQARTASASLDALIQAAGAKTATASLNAAVQAPPPPPPDNADTHDGYFHNLWRKMAQREKEKRETIEELEEELAEIEAEIVEVKSAPIPSRPIVLQSVPIPPIEARTQIIESLIRQAAKIRQEIDDEEETLLLLL